jgi:hypothetical protein
VVVLNALYPKCKAKAEPSSSFHPYRKKGRNGLVIKPDNIKDLKLIAKATFK